MHGPTHLFQKRKPLKLQRGRSLAGQSEHQIRHLNQKILKKKQNINPNKPLRSLNIPKIDANKKNDFFNGCSRPYFFFADCTSHGTHGTPTPPEPSVWVARGHVQWSGLLGFRKIERRGRGGEGTNLVVKGRGEGVSDTLARSHILSLNFCASCKHTVLNPKLNPHSPPIPLGHGTEPHRGQPTRRDRNRPITTLSQPHPQPKP